VALNMREARYRGDCCRSCLRGSLRGLNYLLAIVGVLMAAYALFMYVQWSEATPQPSPLPPPHQKKHHPPAPTPTDRTRELTKIPAQLSVIDEADSKSYLMPSKPDSWRFGESSSSSDSPPDQGESGKPMAKCVLQNPCDSFNCGQGLNHQ
jgi:hypothetical protein